MYEYSFNYFHFRFNLIPDVPDADDRNDGDDNGGQSEQQNFIESLQLEPINAINLPDLNESHLFDLNDLDIDGYFGNLNLEDVNDFNIDILLNEDEHDEHHNEATPATPSTSNPNPDHPSILNNFDPFQRAEPSSMPFYLGGRRRAISLDQKLATIYEEK